ncbi:MAG: hypothetical protein Q9224_007254, partial [Gallowayella concinna]
IYWIISAPVTCATILLPLIAGPTVRYIVKVAYHNRAYSRIVLSLLGVAGEVLMAILVPFCLVIFVIAYGILALGMLCWASFHGRNQLVWASFAAVYAYSLLLDLSIDQLSFVPITGLVPLMFLILILFRFEIGRLSLMKTLGLLGVRLVNILRGYGHLRWFLILLYYILVIVLFLYVSIQIRLPILVITLGILAINRLIRSSIDRKNAIHWRIYGFVLLGSAAVDLVHGSGTVLPFAPMSYAFAVWIYQEYGSLLTKAFRHVRDRVVPNSARQRRQGPEESVRLPTIGRA